MSEFACWTPVISTPSMVQNINSAVDIGNICIDFCFMILPIDLAVNRLAGSRTEAAEDLVWIAA